MHSSELFRNCSIAVAGLVHLFAASFDFGTPLLNLRGQPGLFGRELFGLCPQLFVQLLPVGGQLLVELLQRLALCG